MNVQCTTSNKSTGERSYLVRFFDFLRAGGLCGAGGVASMRRKTSSMLGACCCGFFSAVMVGV